MPPLCSPCSSQPLGIPWGLSGHWLCVLPGNCVLHQLPPGLPGQPRAATGIAAHMAATHKTHSPPHSECSRSEGEAIWNKWCWPSMTPQPGSWKGLCTFHSAPAPGGRGGSRLPALPLPALAALTPVPAAPHCRLARWQSRWTSLFALPCSPPGVLWVGRCRRSPLLGLLQNSPAGQVLRPAVLVRPKGYSFSQR